VNVLGRDDFDTKIKIEKFAEELESEIREMKRFVKFLNMDDKFRKKLKKSIKILEGKLDKIKKSKTLKDASSVINLKK
jgi:hypothetical protein